MSSAWVEVIRAGDFRVHGDLDELLPDVADDAVPHPDDATETEMLDGLPDVVADMLLRTGQLQRRPRRGGAPQRRPHRVLPAAGDPGGRS